MTSSSPLVVSVGRVGVELLGVVPRLPDHDVPVELSEITVQVGGSAAVAAGAAAALGCRTRLGCKLADDFLGGYAVRALGAAGVETRGALDGDRQLSPLSFTALSAGGDRRCFYTSGDAGALSEDDLDIDGLLDGCDAVLLDASELSTQLAVAHLARELGIPVVVDASRPAEDITGLVALADVFLCAERLAGELVPGDRLEDALRGIEAMGPRAAIITLGAAGSIGLHDDDIHQQPSFPVEVVDTSGAGAVYHGVFTAALLSELPFARCMEMASAAAALSCAALGPWAGIPTRDEVEKLARGG